MFKATKNLFGLFGSQAVLTAATILAFWIKFNIVIFTYKPYTATKLFFPLFLLIIVFYLVNHFEFRNLINTRVILLLAVAITFLIPVGYLFHQHDWALYKKMALSFGSFLSLYYATIFLDSKGKKWLLLCVYGFCLIALGYLLLQVYWGWSYEAGHFRNAVPLPRPYGIMDDPDHSSGIYLIGFFFTFSLGFYNKKYFLLFPLALLFVYAILKSQAAGAILALLGGIAVFVVGLIIVFIKQISTKKLFVLLWLVWISLFVFMIGFIGVYRNNIGGFADVIHTFKGESTVLERLDLIMVAKNIFLEHPIFGVGFANDFNPVIINTYKSSAMITNTQLHIHTSYLSALATTGLVGFLFLCALVSLSIWHYAHQFCLKKTKRAKMVVLSYFSLFISIQTLSYSLQYLFSISFWFTLLLPFLISDTENNAI